MLLPQKRWHELFELGVALKGFNGIWEAASGFLVLFVNKAIFSTWFYTIARSEILEDPNDKFVIFFSHLLQNLSSDVKTFAAVYLLAHGLLNIFLAIQLYRDKHWAYLVTIGVMLLFMVYQIYRIAVHHSIFLAALTVIDALFIVLAWHEYKHHRERIKDATPIFGV